MYFCFQKLKKASKSNVEGKGETITVSSKALPSFFQRPFRDMQNYPDSM